MRRVILAALLCLGSSLPARAAEAPAATMARLAGSPFVSTERIGRSAGGRPLEAVVAADPSARRRGAPSVLLICGQHGNEPVAPRAVIEVLGQLAAGRHRDVLERIVTVVVPYANPDGLAAARRANAAGVDLNRDWRERTQPETRALFDLFLRWRPMLVIDAHEWAPGDLHAGNSVELPLFGPQQPEPEWARALGRWASTTLAGCAQRGIYVQRTHWGTANDQRLLHRRAARAWHTPAVLFETMPAGNAPDARRVAGAVTFLSQMLAAAAASAPAPPPPPTVQPARQPAQPTWPGNVALASGLLLILALAQNQAVGGEALRRSMARRHRLKRFGRARYSWRALRPCRPAHRPALVRVRRAAGRRTLPVPSPAGSASLSPLRRG